jgi:hypothetical protein
MSSRGLRSAVRGREVQRWLPIATRAYGWPARPGRTDTAEIAPVVVAPLIG